MKQLMRWVCIILITHGKIMLLSYHNLSLFNLIDYERLDIDATFQFCLFFFLQCSVVLRCLLIIRRRKQVILLILWQVLMISIRRERRIVLLLGFIDIHFLNLTFVCKKLLFDY